VFTLRDLAKIFPEDDERTLLSSLQRLSKQGTLTRAIKRVYVYALSMYSNAHTLERIAKATRRGEYNYLGLESALSE
jgi:cell division inhibitor SulA